MRKFNFLLCGILISACVTAQKIDSIRFFTDDVPLNVELTTDIKNLQSQKGTPVFIPASIKITFPDNTAISQDIKISPRGVNRRETCKIPPMKLDFRGDAGGRLSSLGKLKLVHGCGTSSSDEELLLKEYVCYKIYNMLEPKSFRVRLLHVNYTDTKGRIRPYTQYSYFIEDDANMARRNGCRKKDNPGTYLQETTDRNMMTMVVLFQYMIGNTDWAVPNLHNIALVFRKDNTAALPYAVPFDFDYSGLVDAPYAVPSEVIGTEKVTERVYRGFPRTMEELQLSLDIYRAKKDAIMNYVRNFSLISERTRRTMTDYLEDFYKIIESKKQVQATFIDNARTK
jgi:hypothetical protein